MLNPGDVTIEKQSKKGDRSVAAKNDDDEEEEDDFPRLSLELKLEKAEQVKAEIERERLQALKNMFVYIYSREPVVLVRKMPYLATESCPLCRFTRIS